MNTSSQPPFQLPFRQVHLDFHTSHAILNVGAEFDPDKFADTLQSAHVNSVTCFAKCHMGYLYYDSKLYPERIHPTLDRNLLKEQIEACHARGIRVPIYFDVGWDYFAGNKHPEWLIITPEGKPIGPKPLTPGWSHYFCLNSPYVDYLKALVSEILETLPVDGFFFDIVKSLDDVSIWTRQGMAQASLDITDPLARMQYQVDVTNTFKQEMTALVHGINPTASVFYNSGHIVPRYRDVAETYTHWEIEALVSGGWHPMHFPIAMRYVRTLGQDSLGMTGMFHTGWGDFHSFKHQASLEFEINQMLALNAKCSIGDHLLPSGTINIATYERIGAVYEQVERKEPWCVNAQALTEVAVLINDEYDSTEIDKPIPPGTIGATRMLQEGAIQFDVIDEVADVSAYRVLILPDTITMTDTLLAKLEAFIANGGGIIASFESGFNGAKTDFALRHLGIHLNNDDSLGQGEYHRQHTFAQYVIPSGEIGHGLPETEHAMHIKGLGVTADETAEVLANTVASYFDRSYQHFFSRQAPSSGEVVGPAIVRNSSSIYFAHPIFKQYAVSAPYWVKTLFLNALSFLLPDPLMQHDGPSTLMATLNQQPAENRLILHLLYCTLELRTTTIPITEDVIPLHDITLSVKVEQSVNSVVCVPENRPLDFKQEGNRIRFTLPKLEGHQMITLNCK